MNRTKLIETLQQIAVLVQEAIRQIGYEETSKGKPATGSATRNTVARDISFNMNVLAFMKRYGAGLSGPRKFALLLAYMTKGNAAQEVSFASLKRQWNKMTAVLDGKFNGAYANRAKVKGWVDSPKPRTYTLSGSWKECLSKND